MTLSIIVPVYKVEPYIRRCIDSILTQTFRDFEVILVDDGSPDNCPAICDEYAEKDSRVRVIHKKNGGISDARNAGLDVAQGEYIGFVDSDDFIHPQMYEIMLRVIQKSSADLLQCNLIGVSANQEVKYPTIEHDTEIKIYDAKAVVDQFYPYFWQIMPGYMWCKVFRHQVLDGIRFPVGKYFEDIAILLPILNRCKTVATIDIPLYYYVSNSDSITRQKVTAKHVNDHLNVYQMHISFFRDRNQEQFYRAEEAFFSIFALYKFQHAFAEHGIKGFREIQRKVIRRYPAMMMNPQICRMKKMLMIVLILNKHLALRLFAKYYPELVPHSLRNRK